MRQKSQTVSTGILHMEPSWSPPDELILLRYGSTRN
jgi:hypothetical protein